MRSLLSVVFLLFTAVPLLAQSGARPAKLTVTGDLTCTYPNFLDHQISTDSFALTLPESDGAVSAQGSYSSLGNGYSIAGASEIGGMVRDDAELQVTYRQWIYQGEGVMNGPSPFVPTSANPVVIPLDPGASVSVSHQNVQLAPGTSCSGSITYTLDFERETQVWDVALNAVRQLIYHKSWIDYNPVASTIIDRPYDEGAIFTYDLNARVTLEKRKGAWRYRDGTITQASVQPQHVENPPVHTVLSTSCSGCDGVTALVGKPINGQSDGTTLRLGWSNIRPVFTITAKFDHPCPPGEGFTACEALRTQGGSFSIEDDDVFQRASGHSLNLTQGTQPFHVGSDSPVQYFDVAYRYTLTRVK